jgi:hypothetical protein
MTEEPITKQNTVLELASDKFIYYTINNGLNNEVYISFENISASSKEFWREQWNKKSPSQKMDFSREKFPQMKRQTELLKQKNNKS